MDNVRFNISPCSDTEVAEFIAKIDTRVFVPNGCVKSTDRSHYDRYSFLHDDSRIAVVYDTSANIVSITARGDHARQLLDLFDPTDKSVKSSTVPAQGSSVAAGRDVRESATGNGTFDERSKRAKLFVPPDRIKRRNEFAPVPTVLATSKGVIVTTDEIFPPQTIKRNSDGARSAAQVKPTAARQIQKRPLPSYGETAVIRPIERPIMRETRAQSEHGADNDKTCGIAISVGGRAPGVAPRRAVISFGSDDEGSARGGEFRINTRVQSANSNAQGDMQKRKRGRPRKNAEQTVVDKPAQIAVQPVQEQPQQYDEQPIKRKRGRPRKTDDAVQNADRDKQAEKPMEYKNGYSVKNYSPDALDGAIARLRDYGKTVLSDGVEFAGTPQEVKSYTVTDAAGQKVLLRYATKRMTLQLQGKRSELFGEVMSQVSHDSDYSSALENYVQKSDGSAGDGKVSDVQNKLKKRLPTAYDYLSEQSRIDFSYGIHDFAQKNLILSDYSVLLVPAFRGLERFVFDLQTAENIKVKMIGQAFDKNDDGNYVLKSGYCQRIKSVIYPEVLVALYTEYFLQRNFFAHSDNTGGNVSRSLPERATAQKIFDRLLDVVEYNSKKLKEIGFKIK